jgi:hypothetical protein
LRFFSVVTSGAFAASGATLESVLDRRSPAATPSASDVVPFPELIDASRPGAEVVPEDVRPGKSDLGWLQSKQLIRTFEPVVVAAAELYQRTARADVKRCVASMLARLIDYGVDFGRLDRGGALLSYLLRQPREETALLVRSGLIGAYLDLVASLASELPKVRSTHAGSSVAVIATSFDELWM